MNRGVISILLTICMVFSSLVFPYPAFGGSVETVRMDSSNMSLPLVGLELINGGVNFLLPSFLDKENKEKIKERLKVSVSYFLTGLAIPEEEWWANLNVLIDKSLALGRGLERTLLGKVFLSADLRLKKTAMEIIDQEIGGQYLDFKLDAEQKLRLWIEPANVEVMYNKNKVYLSNVSLKVLVASNDKELTSRLKALVIPKLEEKVNNGTEFAELRNAIRALVLAKWYKQNYAGKIPRLDRTLNSYRVPITYVRRWDVRDYLYRFNMLYLFGGGEDVDLISGGVEAEFPKSKIKKIFSLVFPLALTATLLFAGASYAQDLGQDPLGALFAAKKELWDIQRQLELVTYQLRIITAITYSLLGVVTMASVWIIWSWVKRVKAKRAIRKSRSYLNAIKEIKKKGIKKDKNEGLLPYLWGNLLLVLKNNMSTGGFDAFMKLLVADIEKAKKSFRGDIGIEEISWKPLKEKPSFFEKALAKEVYERLQEEMGENLFKITDSEGKTWCLVDYLPAIGEWVYFGEQLEIKEGEGKLGLISKLLAIALVRVWITKTTNPQTTQLFLAKNKERMKDILRKLVENYGISLTSLDEVIQQIWWGLYGTKADLGKENVNEEFWGNLLRLLRKDCHVEIKDNDELIIKKVLIKLTWLSEMEETSESITKPKVVNAVLTELSKAGSILGETVIEQYERDPSFRELVKKIADDISKIFRQDLGLKEVENSRNRRVLLQFAVSEYLYNLNMIEIDESERKLLYGIYGELLDLSVEKIFTDAEELLNEISSKIHNLSKELLKRRNDDVPSNEILKGGINVDVLFATGLRL